MGARPWQMELYLWVSKNLRVPWSRGSQKTAGGWGTHREDVVADGAVDDGGPATEDGEHRGGRPGVPVPEEAEARPGAGASRGSDRWGGATAWGGGRSGCSGSTSGRPFVVGLVPSDSQQTLQNLHSLLPTFFISPPACFHFFFPHLRKLPRSENFDRGYGKTKRSQQCIIIARFIQLNSSAPSTQATKRTDNYSGDGGLGCSSQLHPNRECEHKKNSEEKNLRNATALSPCPRAARRPGTRGWWSKGATGPEPSQEGPGAEGNGAPWGGGMRVGMAEEANGACPFTRPQRRRSDDGADRVDGGIGRPHPLTSHFHQGDRKGRRITCQPPQGLIMAEKDGPFVRVVHSSILNKHK